MAIGALGLLAALTASPALGDEPMIVDPYELPDAPRALSLPELTHAGIEWTTTTAVGQVVSSGHAPFQGLERLGVEAPLGPRRWYVGLVYEAGYGVPVTSNTAPGFVSGNLELYGRTVWATHTGLAFGAGLGILPPIAVGSSDAALAAVSLQPWDYAFFRVGVFTVRPSVDVRDLTGPFVIQFRQAFDFSVDVTGITSASSDASSTSTLYLGWLAAPFLGLGLEATEYYLISENVADSQRAKVFLAPNVRFLSHTIQPALGAFVDLGTPLSAAGETVWGFRFALSYVWEPKVASPRTAASLVPDAPPVPVSVHGG